MPLIIMMKREDSASATATGITSIYCGQCSVDARPFLHHLRHRRNFRCLCTTCVSRLNSQSFCPTCFLIYESRATPISLPLPDSISCFTCYSSSHSSCVSPNPNNPYICPLCTNPNSPIFNIKNKEIDKKAASVLLAAAKIAANSMNKAAAGAKAEAEKRVKEAAVARKRAKEAMEHLASIETKEKLMKMGLGSAEFSGSGNHRSGIGNRIVTNVGERNLFGDRNRMDKVDGSSAVLEALNAVELREKEKLVVVKSENVVSGGGGSDVALMEVDDNAQNDGTGNEKKSGDLGHELVSVLNVEPIAVLNVDQQQHVQNDHAREGNGGSQQ